VVDSIGVVISAIDFVKVGFKHEKFGKIHVLFNLEKSDFC